MPTEIRAKQSFGVTSSVNIRVVKKIDPVFQRAANDGIYSFSSRFPILIQPKEMADAVTCPPIVICFIITSGFILILCDESTFMIA